jgi:PqqD family protein of HPr-rel-A system
MRDPPGTRWRLADASGMRVQRFDHEALVFNPLTWETHLLNGVAARVLDAVSTTPRAEAELVQDLSGAGERDAAVREEIIQFLRELETLGLTEAIGEDRRAR